MTPTRVHRAYAEPSAADPLGALRAAYPARIPADHPALGFEPLTFGAAEGSGPASGAGPARVFRGGGWTLQGVSVEIGGA